MSSNSKEAKRRSLLSSNEKQVEVGISFGKSAEERGTDELDEAAADQYETNKEESQSQSQSQSVTSQLSIKSINQSSRNNLDKEVVLRRIRHRKRVNKFRAAVGAILSSPFSTNTTGDEVSVPPKRWLDDAFAAL